MKKTILLLAAALLCGSVSATADSLDLSSVLTTSSTVTYTAENDPVSPWTVTDGSVAVTHSDPNNMSWITLNVTSPGSMCISADCDVKFSNNYVYYTDILVNIDGKEAYKKGPYNNYSESIRLFCEEGEHTISIGFNPRSYTYEATFTLTNFIIEDMVHEALGVTLADTGMLGNEILAQANTLPDVKYLKISGPMNDADWSVIKNLTSLLYCDMTDAEVSAIPNEAFRNTDIRIYKFPKQLKSIGQYAFSGKNLIGDIVFPESLENIGNYAFNNTKISSLVFPPAINEIGEYAFSTIETLETVDYGGTMTYMPRDCFSSCKKLKTVTGIQNVKTMRRGVFYGCEELESIGEFSPEVIDTYAFYYAKKLPEIDLSNAKTIGSYAFQYCESLKSIKLSDKITNVGYAAFEYCSSLEEIYLGASVRSLENYAFWNLKNLKNIHLKSPAPPKVSDQSFGYDIPAKATIHVPEYAVVSYKLHDYWSKYTTVEINPETAKEINLYGTLELTSNARIPGAPDLWIGWEDIYKKGGSLTVNGDNPQEIGAYTQMISHFKYYDYEPSTATLLSRCANMTSTASTVKFYCQYSGYYWYYVCMPYDVRYSDVTTENGASVAVRRYDGEVRAEMGGSKGTSWVELAEDEILHAGEGYIFCVSKEDYVILPATDDTHNMIFTSDAVTTDIKEYPATYTADAGWNLVGNPYPCFYDISHMDYTAPITVWDTNNRTYTAYSVADDDLVLLPLQAFFVQRPAGIDAVTFQPRGRQTDLAIERPAQIKAKDSAAATRRVVDLQLSDGTTADMTRLVVNPDADTDFDPATDASKMLSYETTAQIYSIGTDAYYAINEGVMVDTAVALGVWMPADGQYTIDATRTDAKVELYDNGRLVMMPYSFQASAGTDNIRFMVKIAADVTGIDTITNDNSDNAPIYDLMGRRVANPTKGIYIQNNKKIYK